MQDYNYERINPAAKKVWMINGFIFSVIILAAVVAVTLLLYKSIWIISGGIVLSLFITVISPLYEYKQWKYSINAEKVEIIHGIFIVQRTVIPINRVQHINIKQGLIQKHYDISGVEIFTAGGRHAIEGLHSAVATQIADHLNTLVIQEGLDG